MAEAEVKVSLLDAQPVRDLLVAGIRLYDALYHMPGATEFFTKAASNSVCQAYADMASLVRTSPLAIVEDRHEESA